MLSGTLLLIMGIVTAFNFLVIKFKLEAARYADAVLDIAIFLALAVLFGSSSINGLLIAMVASGFASIVLYFFPPNFPDFDPLKE